MDIIDKYRDLIINRFKSIVLSIDEPVKNEIYISLTTATSSSLNELYIFFRKNLKSRFVGLFANDERRQHNTLSVYTVFSIPDDDCFLITRYPISPTKMEIPSISRIIPAALWFEREMKDWFGIIAFPNVGKLAVHPDWPDDVFLMLKDFDPKQHIPRVNGTFEFRRVEGEGVFEIPVGPVHAGIIEPGHFRFSVAGEPIINLDAQLFYVHKGTEKIAEGMLPRQALFLAERISGDSSFAHTLAFCHAVERLSGIEVPQRAIIIRTMLLELERIYNHIGDIGAILLDVGFGFGASTASRLKEQFMQLNEVLTGSRLLRGMTAIGGIRRPIENSPKKRELLSSTLKDGRNKFEQLIDLAMSSSTVRDRLETTGILSQKDANRLGIVGIAGRASGIKYDTRKDHPHCAYPYLKFQPAFQESGDVFARMNVRIDEVRESLVILEQLHNQYIDEPILNTAARCPVNQHALGFVEGWRGEIFHWVMTDDDGKIYRWKVIDPSFHNWRALKVAVRNNIVPDFPVINKSFNLSYSGNDR